MARNKRKNRIANTLAVCFWLCAWQAASVCIGQKLILVSPLEVCGALLALLPTADFWQTAAFSAGRIIGGFLLALLLYLIVGIHLPAMAAWIFVVLWGVISYFGYSRSASHYASCLRQNERAIRDIENTIRRHYNEAKDCFLPLDYTAPSVLRELIAGLDSGMIASFEDYRINN